MQAFPPRLCSRCNGAMITERDWYGAYSTCLQCGFVHEMVTSPAIDLLDAEESTGTRQRRRQPSHGKLRL